MWVVDFRRATGYRQGPALGRRGALQDLIGLSCSALQRPWELVGTILAIRPVILIVCVLVREFGRAGALSPSTEVCAKLAFQMALHNHSWQTMDVLRLFTTDLWREHRDVDKTGFLYQRLDSNSIGDPLMTVLQMGWIPVILSTSTVRDKEMILPVHRRQRRRVRCVRLGGRPGRGETGPGSPTCGPRTPYVHAGRRTGTRRACSSANAKQLLASGGWAGDTLFRRQTQKVRCVLGAEVTA